MTDPQKIPIKNRLIYFAGALRELNQLAEVLGEVNDETDPDPHSPISYYIGARREQLMADIARLRGEINQPTP